MEDYESNKENDEEEKKKSDKLSKKKSKILISHFLNFLEEKNAALGHFFN